jgi:hypothetical protein
VVEGIEMAKLPTYTSIIPQTERNVKGENSEEKMARKLAI